ncbi:MAG: lysylphosphatidylglycerol synthase domain-containing protein [Vicinamibacterales bacterium]
MTRSVPQVVAVGAALLGVALFLATLYYIDLDETVASASRLGLALPIVLLPGTAWHLLRTWGWSIAFPDAARPAFTRLFRVRLAADAISFFTVRGIAGEPLKVLLLYDRVKPEVTTAAIALERLTFAVIGTAIAGVISLLAIARVPMSGGWDALFALLALGAVVLLGIVGVMARRRSQYYLGQLVAMLDRVTGRRLERHRAVRFILDVEHVLLDLLRGDRRRLVTLVGLAAICYAVMATEVWLVFWAIGERITVMEALIVETFARLASVAFAFVPANIGTLEASNVAVAEGLRLTGGGSLALARRIRALLWAGLGLVLYPRVTARPAHPPPQPAR